MCMQKTKTEQIFESSHQTKEEVIKALQLSPVLYRQYRELEENWQQRFMDFCIGKKTLPLTYDPFFKKIFHPDVHPERLSDFLSAILGQAVRVIRILPTEDTSLDGSALLIMDILVELEDGSLANIEVQKIPYKFPAERMSCYSADLLLRQYNRVKGERGKKFKYSDIKKVYTIILFEQSTQAFHKLEGKFIHRGKTTFNTGLELELLQEYCLVALDVFRKMPYPKEERKVASWIGLLATETIDDAQRLISEYPWLKEIYVEMAEYMRKPEEVLSMFSDALKILDHNTVQYMIEELAEQIEKQQVQINDNEEKLQEAEGQLEEAKGQLEEAKGQLEEAKGQLEEAKGKLQDAKDQLADKDRQIEELTKLVKQFQNM